MQTNKLNGISLIIEATKFDYEKIYNIIKNVPRLIDKYPYFEGMIDDMNVFVSKMKSDYELFEQKLSYQFNLFIPFEKIERARFIKKLKKSVDNINNLDVKENELNSILIGLSPAQSIYEAKKILEKEMN